MTERYGELTLAIEGNGREATLRLSGELDMSSVRALEAKVGELCADGSKAIVIDLGGLSFMDSTGLRSLLVSQELCEVGGCTMRLIRPTAQIARLIELTDLAGRLGLEGAAGSAGQLP